MDLSWLNVTEILLLLGACWACFQSGKIRGVTEIVELMLHRRIITADDLKKLED